MHAVGRVFFIVMLGVATLHHGNSVANGLDSPEESIRPLREKEKGTSGISVGIGLKPFDHENYENKHVDDMEDVLKRRKQDGDIRDGLEPQDDNKVEVQHSGVKVKVIDGKVISHSPAGNASPEDVAQDEAVEETSVADYDIPSESHENSKANDRKSALIEGKRAILKNKRRQVDTVIELEEYGKENSHLPSFQTMEGLYKNAFYSVGANDHLGLMAVLRELAALGENVEYVLEDLRTKEGDNLLIHAVKSNAVDVVRYLISIGSNVDVTDANGDTPLNLAMARGNVEIINAIAEVTVQYDIENEEDGEVQS